MCEREMGSCMERAALGWGALLCGLIWRIVRGWSGRASVGMAMRFANDESRLGGNNGWQMTMVCGSPSTVIELLLSYKAR